MTDVQVTKSTSLNDSHFRHIIRMTTIMCFAFSRAETFTCTGTQVAADRQADGIRCDDERDLVMVVTSAWRSQRVHVRQRRTPWAIENLTQPANLLSWLGGELEEYREPQLVDILCIGRRWTEVFTRHAWMPVCTPEEDWRRHLYQLYQYTVNFMSWPILKRLYDLCSHQWRGG